MPSLKLHHIPGSWGLSSISPFCLKLETYLRMSELEYETVLDGNPFAGPKKKLPWIELDGKQIGDSGFIIDYLNQRDGVDLDKTLSPEQRAQAHALRRLLEENLYWVMVYDRWFIEENWAWFKHVVLADFSKALRLFVAPIARRSVKKELLGHGIGLHSPEELHQIGIQDINAVSAFLGDKAFMMGDESSQVDASAYGAIANIIQTPVVSPVKEAGLKTSNLLAYCQRMQKRYFPDSD
jgi:glutathione S-transferase